MVQAVTNLQDVLDALQEDQRLPFINGYIYAMSNTMGSLLELKSGWKGNAFNAYRLAIQHAQEATTAAHSEAWGHLDRLINGE